MLNKAFYSILLRNTFQIVILCIVVSTLPLPQKHHTLILAKLTPLKSANCPSPLFKQSPSTLVFHETSLKVGFFSEPQKYQSFSSLTPSYLLKATKFLVEISKFEFLVMTEKNIFAHKLFLPLNIQILIF